MSRVRTEDVITSETQGTKYEDLSISDEIMRGLADSGYVHPTPVQLKSIPIGLLGADMIVKGKAGTGKTLIFAILTLETVDVKSALPQAVIITSTRELALQSADVIRKVGRHRDGLACGTFIGGTSKADDKRTLRNCQVVVGSAGRLKDLICETGDLYVGSVKLFCLDEVDALMQGKDTHAAINQIYRALPERKQVCTFSATYIPSLIEILHTYMRTPRFITVEDPKVSLRGVSEYYVEIAGKDECAVTAKKTSELLRIVCGVPFTQCIVFCNDFDQAQVLTRRLCSGGIAADCISSRFEQAERSATIKKFADFAIRILVSSDLTARGIDMAKVNLVMSLDVPQNAETYMHRIGRTGRYGSLGLAIALFTRGEMQKIALCRRELKADSPFVPLPPLEAIDVSYMQGVVTTEEDKKKYEAFEKERAEGKSTAVPRTARRQVKVKKAGEKRPRGDPDEGEDQSSEAPAKRRKERSAVPSTSSDDAHCVRTPHAVEALAAPPVADSSSHPHHQPLPTHPYPPAALQAPPAMPVMPAPAAHAYTAPLSAPAAAATPVAYAPAHGTAHQQQWVAAAHARLCDHYNQYYRAYYSAATDCLVKTFTGGGVAVPPPPPPAAPAL